MPGGHGRDLEDLVATRAWPFIRAFFEESPVGLNLCTMDGVWLASNPAFLRMIGYTREEADGGLTYWQLTPRRYDEAEAAQLESLRTTHRYGPYEKEFVRKDGSLVPVRLHGFLVERDGVPYIWSLIEDLTDQRALEARLALERRKALHAAKLAVLGETAASIAHEIANPLAVIRGYATGLRGALARGDLALAREALDALDAESERAARIVKSMQRFSRNDRNGAGPPTGDAPDVIDLADALEEALLLARIRARAHHVTISCDHRATRRVRGRSLAISQALVNLLHNGVDAAASGGTREVTVTTADGPGDGWVSIVVEDSGPPIAPEVAARLFEPFFTTKPPGDGTGLGLSISRELIEGLGGTLEHDPSALRTRFVVRLRAA
jgi:PAS domain S-box-containing protein